MHTIGTVDSLWRYPVKSMRGEELTEAFIGFSGVYGDRLFAFHSSTAPKAFPYLTAREQRALLRYRPRFRHADKAARPLNLDEAERLGSGVTPVYARLAELTVDVETPTGHTLAIDDPALVRLLAEDLPGGPTLSLVASERAQTDCRPVSLLSLQSVRRLGEELGRAVDTRRFRENIYLDLPAGAFSEDALIGQTLLLGPKVKLSILQPDARCVMITLDPDSAAPAPDVLRHVARTRSGKFGVYAAVLVEGMVRKGDPVQLLD